MIGSQDNLNFPLREVLLYPATAAAYDLGRWDLLLQQARGAGLLARVAAVLRDAGLDDRIPPEMRWHLDSAFTVYRAHSEDVRLEVEHIARALKPAGVRPVLLKGAAYLAAGDRARLGRLYSDVDIFVPHDSIDTVEQLLRWQGWSGEELSDYDQAYYRRWMHEIPPLIHRSRGIAVDVHHNLLPLTSRVKLDAEALAAGITPSEFPGVDVLAPTDRVLHSAAHLLLEGEFDNAFRDLSDLYLLLTELSAADPGFWDALLARSRELGLHRILYYALRYLARLLDLAVPPDITAGLQSAAPVAPVRWVMDRLFTSALLPISVAAPGVWPGFARFALYLRSHYLKMPLPLLARHLWHKAVITPFEYRQTDPV
ncbi:MAG: nucleotidyltransferase family protein [Haliea sp.]|uniref:nucleotidyltransferase domain-containing protein n=1 Tax=Haliea sp. TaxID=1932666 RepID=UPI0032EEFEE1